MSRIASCLSLSRLIACWITLASLEPALASLSLRPSIRFMVSYISSYKALERAISAFRFDVCEAISSLAVCCFFRASKLSIASSDISPSAVACLLAVSSWSFLTINCCSRDVNISLSLPVITDVSLSLLSSLALKSLILT